jgi:hypothetical protein
LLSNNFPTPANLIGVIGVLCVYLPGFLCIFISLTKPLCKQYCKCCIKNKNKILHDDDPVLGTIQNDKSTIDVTITKGWGPLA